MRLSKDKSSYRSRGIIRRDERHTKSAKEVEKPRSKKDTRKWCKGKVGRLHAYEWQLDAGKFYSWWQQVCCICNKKGDHWFSAFQSITPMPDSLRKHIENQS